jgi:hypothetical protein
MQQPYEAAAVIYTQALELGNANEAPSALLALGLLCATWRIKRLPEVLERCAERRHLSPRSRHLIGGAWWSGSGRQLTDSAVE